MKRFIPYVGLLTLAAAIAGCSGPPPAADSPGGTSPTGGSTGGETAATEPASVPGKYGGKFVQATTSDPKTFNRWLSAETSSSDALDPLYDTLNYLNPFSLKYEPMLADLPKVSEDGLTYTYQLREGLKWSDGRPLTADDVIFTLDMIKDPKTETIMREGLLIDVPQADGSTKREFPTYRKIDDRTVEFKLPVKFAPAESAFSFPIAPKHKLEGPFRAGKINTTWSVSTSPSELVASGAWIIAEYQPRQRLIYRRNPNYWRKTADGKPLPYLDEWVVLFVPDINTAQLKFRNKDLDIVAVQAPDYSSFKDDESAGDYTVINRGPNWGFQFFNFNMNPNSKVDPILVRLFQDTRFRQATSHCLDRQRICDDIYLGLAKPGYGPLTPANSVFYNPDVPKFEYDLEKAKSLLAEIGLKDSDGNKMLEYQGQEVKFNILVLQGSDIPKQIANIFTDDLKKVGINAQFSIVDFNDLVRRLDSPPYDWEACMIGFTGGPEPHSGSNIWRSSGPNHQWWPKQTKPATEWEAEIDRLWIQGSQELDPAKRKEIYNQWQKIAAEQQPFIYTVVTDQLTAVRNRFGNLKPSTYRVTAWNIHEIFDTTATRDNP